MLFLFVPRLLSRGSQRVGMQSTFVSEHTSWIACLCLGALTLLEPIFWAACQAQAYAFQVGYVTPRVSRGLSSHMSRGPPHPTRVTWALAQSSSPSSRWSELLSNQGTWGLMSPLGARGWYLSCDLPAPKNRLPPPQGHSAHELSSQMVSQLASRSQGVNLGDTLYGVVLGKDPN